MPLEAPPPHVSSQPGFAQVYQYLLPRLNFMAREFPFAEPTSWWRSQGRNVQVGGDPRSQHLLAFAADWSRLNAGERDRFCRTARGIGLICVDEGDHVHVQTFPRFTLPAQLFARQFSV